MKYSEDEANSSLISYLASTVGAQDLTILSTKFENLVYKSAVKFVEQLIIQQNLFSN